MSERVREFEDAVGALLDALAGRGEFAQSDLDIVIDGVDRYLRATVDGLREETRSDSIDVALVEFIAQARAGRVDRNKSPAGFLIQRSRWRALDHLRRERRFDAVAGIDEQEDQADDVRQSLEAIASEAQIGEVIHRNRLAERHDLNRIIRVALNLSERGYWPTTRNIGAELGLAPSTVAAKLAEIRAELVEVVR